MEDSLQATNKYADRLEVRAADTVLERGAIMYLYESGLLDGAHAQNDSEADIENLEQAYYNDEGRSGFWVAVLHGIAAEDQNVDEQDPDDSKVIGMVGVQNIDLHTAEVRRLRVDPDFRNHGVGTRLMEQALAFCLDRGYLKVILDTRIDRIPAIKLFEQFGFQLNRTRDVQGKEVRDFYLNLYIEKTVNTDTSQDS